MNEDESYKIQNISKLKADLVPNESKKEISTLFDIKENKKKKQRKGNKDKESIAPSIKEGSSEVVDFKGNTNDATSQHQQTKENSKIKSAEVSKEKMQETHQSRFSKFSKVSKSQNLKEEHREQEDQENAMEKEETKTKSSKIEEVQYQNTLEDIKKDPNVEFYAFKGKDKQISKTVLERDPRLKHIYYEYNLDDYDTFKKNKKFIQEQQIKKEKDEEGLKKLEEEAEKEEQQQLEIYLENKEASLPDDSSNFVKSKIFNEAKEVKEQDQVKSNTYQKLIKEKETYEEILDTLQRERGKNNDKGILNY